jgi:hypothetical protein
LRWVHAGDLNWWLLLLSTATIFFARRASQGNPISITMTVPTTYRRQFSHEQQRPNSTLHLFNLYKRSSVFRVLAGSVAPVHLLSFSKILGGKKKSHFVTGAGD